MATLDRKQLVQLSGDLYRLSKENKDFSQARFALGAGPLAPYKKTIKESMYPDVCRNEPIQVSKAKRAIAGYSQAVEDPLSEAELMTLFVACGNSFSIEFGDIDEGFYEAMNLMYKRALEKVLRLPVEQRGDFRVRLKEIMTSSTGIVWGYHDELCHDFYEEFPEDE